MRGTTWTSRFVAALFLVALWMPLLGMFFGIGEFGSADENRTLAALPKPGIGVESRLRFGKAYTRYFHDHFAFRATLITAQALLKVKLLGVSSSPDVVIGKEGWLFYEGDKSMVNYRGMLPFAADELES